MAYLARQKIATKEFEPRAILPPQFNDIMERWLSGDASANIAPIMYVGDMDASRWVKGHSSSDYYIKRDENAALEKAMREIKDRYENFIDMGVGGDDAVRRALQKAKAVGAKNYYPVDLAYALAENAERMATGEGFRARKFVCNMFKPLPFNIPNSLIAILGLYEHRNL